MWTTPIHYPKRLQRITQDRQADKQARLLKDNDYDARAVFPPIPFLRMNKNLTLLSGFNFKTIKSSFVR